MKDTEPFRLIKLAILAVGGQGGGVLTNWISDLAERSGWRAQSTVVAGVAQRTGATIYYIEMAPDTGREPVFALAPAQGDVDVLIAAEWMEAGRAVMRGFVTPDRTTVIASTHRMLAVAEKIVPGDGRAPDDKVSAALEVASARVVAFDMQTPAERAGSVISATIFGALASSATLPFAPEAYEEVIRASGRGVEASLRAFRAGLAGGADQIPGSNPYGAVVETGSAAEREAWSDLNAKVGALPGPVQEMATVGLAKVVDFQGTSYGAAYLAHLERFVSVDDAEDRRLSVTAAKYLANAMAYDDVIRVADLKTRARRQDRIESENPGELTHVTEYLHPRIDEVCGTLPAGLGAWIEARPRLYAWLGRRIDRGRRVRSSGLGGFLTLYLVAGLRRWRPVSLRHKREMAHVENWLNLALETARSDYGLGLEILACRRLIKGYSDTHERGQAKYDQVLEGLKLLAGRSDAADWARRLREAALQDAEGEALQGALKTVASFAVPGSSENARAASAPAPSG